MFLFALAESIQLLPDGSLLIHIAMILAMIWILNRTFFRPINEIIEKREKSKGGHSSEAVEILSEASDKRSEYTKALQETRSEGYTLIEEERDQAVAAKKERVDTAKEEIASDLKAQNAELDEQVATARASIDEEAERMAEKIRANVLGGAS